jgi:hypothetical protein
MLYRFRIGIYLTRRALARHGTDSFWPALSWWHEEVHYTIPRIEEEKRVAEELKAAFEDGYEEVDIKEWLNPNVSNVGIWSTGTPLTSSMPLTMSSLSTPVTTTNIATTNNVFTISPPSGGKGYAGQWKWGGVGVNVVDKPSWVRRMTVSVLLGAEWVDDKGQKAKTKKTPLPSEYIRWGEFLSEAQG